jgi:elongation factor Ts
MADINKLKKLREETGASIADIRIALEEAGDDEGKAREFIKERGLARAAKKSERETKAGVVESYVHSTMTSGAMVTLSVETDFVAKTAEFRGLAREIAMQVCAMRPETVEELLEQPYIRDAGKSINDLVQEAVAKFGENIQIRDFKRFEV